MADLPNITALLELIENRWGRVGKVVVFLALVLFVLVFFAWAFQFLWNFAGRPISNKFASIIQHHEVVAPPVGPERGAPAAIKLATPSSIAPVAPESHPVNARKRVVSHRRIPTNVTGSRLELPAGAPLSISPTAMSPSADPAAASSPSDPTLTPPPSNAVLRQPSETTVDEEYWESVRRSKRIRLFYLYLERFPNGLYADLAREKIAILEARRRNHQ